MDVTIIGATGFIGKHLSAALLARGDAVRTASLRDPAAAAAACDGADAVVNLAGAPIVGKRWDDAYKAEIRASRTDAPRALLDVLAKASRKPDAYVSASATGYYGTSETATFTEASPPGDDFLAHVCIEWERTAARAAEFGMRVACIRTGIVLGAGGGALAKLLPVFRLGLGGPVASGRQWYSWVHVDDIVGVYLHAIDGASGALNATAPNPVTNADFTRALASAVKRPAFFPVPALALQFALGEAATVLTQGQRVLPEQTLASGYAFKYAQIADALRAILA
jgi:uncharacterized protein (TIGR01777 family)